MNLYCSILSCLDRPTQFSNRDSYLLNSPAYFMLGRTGIITSPANCSFTAPLGILFGGLAVSVEVLIFPSLFFAQLFTFRKQRIDPIKTQTDKFSKAIATDIALSCRNLYEAVPLIPSLGVTLLAFHAGNTPAKVEMTTPNTQVTA